MKHNRFSEVYWAFLAGLIAALIINYFATLFYWNEVRISLGLDILAGLILAFIVYLRTLRKYVDELERRIETLEHQSKTISRSN